jgi:hypothetical protein
MITHSYVPQDLRTVDPRRPAYAQTFDEWSAKVVAVRVELRFGPDSDIAQMLGLVSPTQETDHRMERMGAHLVGRGKWAYTCERCGQERFVDVKRWRGGKVCRTCRRGAVLS